MQTVFINAFHWPQPEILGLRLKPLSLSHIHFLDILGSPLLDFSREHSDIDTVLACTLLANDWASNCEWVSNEMHNDVKDYCNRLNLVKPDYTQALTALLLYWSHYFQFPERWSKSRSARSTKHPWQLYVAGSLVQYFDEERVWNMPLPLALTYFSSLSEVVHGDDSLLEDYEIEELTGAANG